MATLNGEKSNQVSGESGIPEKPPDGEGGEVVQILSYKDRVLGKVSVLKEPTSLLHEGVMILEYEGGNWMLLKFITKQAKFEQLYMPWKNCLIMKLLGKNVGFLTMREKLKFVWKLEGGFKLMGVTHGY